MRGREDFGPGGDQFVSGETTFVSVSRGESLYMNEFVLFQDNFNSSVPGRTCLGSSVNKPLGYQSVSRYFHESVTTFYN